MTKLSAFFFILSFSINSFSGTIRDCTGQGENQMINFQLSDSWDLGNAQSKIIFNEPVKAEFKVVYSYDRVMVAISESETDGLIDFPVSLVELKWSGYPEVSGQLKIGQKQAPRNHMGIYRSFEFRCN